MISSVDFQNPQQAFNPNIILRGLSAAGRVIPDKVVDFCDLNSKGSFKRISFLALALVFMMGARYFKSRDEDEKREVLIRDSGTIFTAVYGVPILKKVVGYFVNKLGGIPIAFGDRNIMENLNPEKGFNLVSYAQLKDWFSVKDGKAFGTLKGGFGLFLENIHNLGGNLSKCFNILGGKETTEKLAEIAKRIGFAGDLNSENILKLVQNVQNSKQNEDLLTPLKELFVGDNKLLKKASSNKAVIEIGAILTTVFLLGGLLPWFNIRHTRDIYAHKNGNSTGNKNGVTLNMLSQQTMPKAGSMKEKFEQFKNSGVAI